VSPGERGSFARNSAIEILLAYYGDDFTGSTDVLEALSHGGVPTVLFIKPPTPEQLAAHSGIRAVGVAGTGRTMSPAEMDAALPGAFTALKRLRPQFVHYKVCSTFDSSPQIGSIGRAIDIGFRVFDNRFVPLVVGAPVLQRFCVFGNLFARSGLDSPTYRLDRHPTMSVHPVTPMNEADLRVHLASQTDRQVKLVDALALEAGHQAATAQLEQLTREPGCIVLFDTLTDTHLAVVGQLLSDAQACERKPLFIAGSSGVEYALTKHWGDPADARRATVSPVEHVLVVSGSCSPVTGRQVAWAVQHGFAEAVVGEVTASIVAANLEAGRSMIVHTQRGVAADGQKLGRSLGQLLRDVLHTCRPPRAAVVGGDTSGQVARAIGIEALEYVGPLEPGAPLCRARSRDSAVDGLEMAFKGGQVGYDDFFATLLRGRRER
jgi:uncharacterized protein YgbK (DUF1537 family)